MNKKIFAVLSTLVLILLLAGCGCRHEWQDATCTAPKTCSLCEETEGEVLPHTWQDATCTAAKTCSVCNETEGAPLGHTWNEATCTEVRTCTVCQATEGEPAGHTWKAATCSLPKTCSVCQATEGKAAGHKWQEATTEAPKTCSVCKTTDGSKLNTDSRFTTKATKALQGTWVTDVTMTDDTVGSVECRITMKLGNTGNLTMSSRPKDEASYREKLTQALIQELYAEFANRGLSKEQADEAMILTYGMNVNDYAASYMKGIDLGGIFDSISFHGVYYVEGNTLYRAASWGGTFEANPYSFSGSKLVIDGFTVDGIPVASWTRG